MSMQQSLSAKIQQNVKSTIPVKVNHKSNFNMNQLMEKTIKNNSSPAPNTKVIYSSAFKISDNLQNCYSKIQLISQKSANKRNIFQALCEETFEKISLHKNKGQNSLRQSRRIIKLYPSPKEDTNKQKQIDFADNNLELSHYRSQFFIKQDQPSQKIFNGYLFDFNLPQPSKRNTQTNLIKAKFNKKQQIDNDNNKSSRYQIKTVKKSQQRIQSDSDFIKPPIQSVRNSQSKSCMLSSRIKSAIKLSNRQSKQQLSQKKTQTQSNKNIFLIHVSAKQFSIRPRQKNSKLMRASMNNKIKSHRVTKTEIKSDLEICPWIYNKVDPQY